MNKPKFTPGPWKLRLCQDKPGEIRSLYGYTVTAENKIPYISSAGVSHPNYTLIPYVPEGMKFDNKGFTHEEVAANARLISKAPEMYEAIREFVERCDKGEIKSRKTYAAFKQLLEEIDGQ